MRVGPYDGKYDQRLVDVGTAGRTSSFFLFSTSVMFPVFCASSSTSIINIIPHQWLNLLLAERALGLTFINTGFYYMYVVESGNTLYYLSLHISILSASFALVTGYLPSLRH